MLNTVLGATSGNDCACGDAVDAAAAGCCSDSSVVGEDEGLPAAAALRVAILWQSRAFVLGCTAGE